jgi:hypothetical protein
MSSGPMPAGSPGVMAMRIGWVPNLFGNRRRYIF